MWAKSFGSLGGDAAMGVAVDSADNVVLAGYFSQTVDFGGGPLVSGGSLDAFMAKYSPTGAYVWAKRIGGLGADYAYSVAIDSTNNVVVAGAFTAAADFGGGLLTNAGQADIFVAKYTSAGSYLWAKGVGGIGDDRAYGVAVDRAGNVLLTGYFNAQVDFGGGLVGSTNLNSSPIFLTKYSPNGAYVWAQVIGGNTTWGTSVTCDSGNNVICTGVAVGPANFGNGLTFGAGGWDYYLAKYTPSGTYLWAKRSRCTTADAGYSVAVDRNDNVCLAGIFGASIDFGCGTLTSGASYNDGFVAQFSP
jgi:hypothetical protein